MDTPDRGHQLRPRTRQGRFTVRAETAERDAKACRLRVQGMSYDQIAQELGFRDKSSARRAVQRAIVAVVREPAEELIELEAERLDDLTRHLQRIVTTRHYAVTVGGKLARNPETGELVPDNGPVIAALRELRMVSESRRRLLGLDAPAKHRVDVIDNAAIDAELLRLADELDQAGDRDGARETREAVSGAQLAIEQ